MDIKPWKLLSSKTSFENRWWKIVQETVELPDGTVYEDYFVNHNPGGVVVFALTEAGGVLVNRQYKHGARETIEELTIGRFDDGETDALAAAQRELLEETGHGGGEWEKLATWVSNPTSSTSRIHAFLARGVKKLAEQKGDPREIIELREVPPKELLAMAFDGRLSTQASLATVLLAAKRLGWLEATV
jgi:ADP-ribose pyrophosphatase YjhB (NUDIX family)